MARNLQERTYLSSKEKSCQECGIGLRVPSLKPSHLVLASKRGIVIVPPFSAFSFDLEVFPGAQSGLASSDMF